MGQAATRRNARYTYADYLGWPDDERWELIGGLAYNKTPAPSITHQRVSRELFFQFVDQQGYYIGCIKVNWNRYDARRWQ